MEIGHYAITHLAVLCIFYFLVCMASNIEIQANSRNTSETKTSSKERITQIVNEWQRDFSGRPVNCIPMQFLFNGLATVQTPNGTVSGLSRIFHWCQDYWEAPYMQVELFITSPLFFDLSKANKSPSTYSVAFQRTILLVTHHYCRVSWQGITELEFDEEFRIKLWKEFYDLEALDSALEDCTFPSGFTEEEINELKSRIGGLDQHDPNSSPDKIEL